MGTELEKIKRIFSNCKILLDNQVISDNSFIKAYISYLGDTVCAEERCRDVVLHTGSICFDAVTLVVSAINNLVYTSSTPDAVINSLEIGDIVIYDSGKLKKRCKFLGYVDSVFGKSVKLQSISTQNGIELENTDIVSRKNWNKITPYFGDSQSMDGRGVRGTRTKRIDFLSSVLKTDKASIPSVADASSVVVMSRDEADDLIDKISIRYNSDNKEKTILFTELATVSYYTENDEYRFGGNAARTEPLIKIAGKMSVARDLIVRPGENSVTGICVLGESFIERDQSEIINIMNRRSLRYVLVSTNVDSEAADALISENEDVKVFPCTKDFLLSYALPEEPDGYYLRELNSQIDCIINNEVKPFVIESRHTWEEYKKIKKNINFIREMGAHQEERDFFVMQSFSLLNLFITVPFTLEYLESFINKKSINIISPKTRIEKLKENTLLFSGLYAERAKSVTDFLESLYIQLYSESEKEKFLKKYIGSQMFDKIAIVVPKAYYVDVLWSEIWLRGYEDRIDIVSANRFDNSIHYDFIITVGVFGGKSFNIYRCKSAESIYPLIFEFEEKLCRYQEQKARKAERTINSRAHSAVDTGEFEDDETEEQEIEAFVLEDLELDDYIRELNEISLLNNAIKYGGNPAAPDAEISKIVRFNDGEMAFFTKYYRPYIFDSVNRDVKEADIQYIQEGDNLVFTQNNSETKDIVESVLNSLINSGSAGEELKKAYDYSKRWKKVLRDYMYYNSCSSAAVTEILKKHGSTKGVGAIRDWADPDSHTVGPLDAESYKRIGEMAGDKDLYDNSAVYCSSCDTVRKIRRRILKEIGLTIIGNLTGKKENQNSLLSAVSEKLDSLYEIKQVESVSDAADRRMPSYMINRPLALGE